MKTPREQPLLHKGDIVREGDVSFTVQRKLGEGQFAEVWEVKQNNSNYDARVQGLLSTSRNTTAFAQQITIMI